MSEIGVTIIMLECGRELRFSIAPPRTGEFVYCSYHLRMERVISGDASYRVRCTQCRYSRSYGAARLTAETRAATHAATKNHTVRVMNGREVVHTFDHTSAQQSSLLDALDVPPF